MRLLDSMFANPLTIEKWHGAENDFLFVNLRNLTSACKTSTLSHLRMETVAMVLCQRHTGLGADGIVVWVHDPVHSKTAAAIWNSDGSRAQTCGNALRCLAGVLLDKQLWDGKTPLDVRNLEESEDAVLQTGSCTFARLLSASHSENMRDFSASVGMGSSRNQLTKLLAPVEPYSTTSSLNWMQSVQTLTFVQLANPHLVVQLVPGAFAQHSTARFCEMGKYFQSDEVCRKLGIPLSNIGFVEPNPQSGNSVVLNAIVYERGAGLTQCCGSGGCAMRVALKEDPTTQLPEGLQLKMPGGVIVISEDNDELVLTGPAKKIARLEAHL